MSAPASMSPALTTPGPSLRSTRRFGPSACLRSAISLMLRTMSVTSSRTPAMEENSCSTPSICTEVTAAPCSEESSTRRSALPSVVPKPRSSGSATRVASALRSRPAETLSLVGLIRSCQFFCNTVCRPFLTVSGAAGSSVANVLVQHVRRNVAFRLVRRGGACGGRQPLCGIGVTSRIEVTLKPPDCSARSADSRPEPGPLTSTSRVFMPCSIAFLPASSAATCAA